MAAPVQAMAVAFQDEDGGAETIGRNPGDPMKIKDSQPGNPARTDTDRSLTAFSQTDRTTPDLGAQPGHPADSDLRIRILTH